MTMAAFQLRVVFDAPPLGLGVISGVDSTMENGNNWTAGGSTTLGFTTVNPHTGLQSMTLTRTGTSGTASAQLSNIPAVAGRDYLLWAWLLAQTSARFTFAQINWRTAGGGLISSSSVNGADSTSRWVTGRLGMVATAPATCTKFDLIVGASFCAVGETHQLDTVTVDYAGTDITGRVLNRNGESRGRNDELNRVDAGQGTWLLSNDDGWVTPGDTSGPPAPYLGNILDGKKVIVLGTFNSILYPRWTGYTQSWVMGNVGDQYSEVTLTAYDAFRLGSPWTVNAPYRAEVLLDSPATFLPLGEPQGATSAGDIAGSGLAAPLVASKYGNGGGAFGATSVLSTNDTGRNADGGSTALALNGSVGITLKGDCLDLSALPSAWPTPGQPWTVKLWVQIPSIPGTEAMIYRCSAGGFPDAVCPVQMSMLTSGQLSLTTGAVVGAIVPPFGSAGGIHQLAIGYDPSVGAFGAFNWYIEGTLYASYTNLADPFGGQTPTLAQAGGIIRPINRSAQAQMVGSLQHIETYNYLLSAGRIAAHYQIGRFGGFPEDEGNRVGGILNLVGWPAADTAIDAGLTSLLDRDWDADVNALGLMQDTAANGSAVILATADGKFGMQNRQRRVNTSSLATFRLSTATDAEPDEYSPYLDDVRVENVVQAGRTVGGTIIVSDATSIAARGKRQGQPAALAIVSQAEVSDYAQWRLLKLKDAKTRVDTIRFRPDTSDALWPLLLALELGDRITLADLPALAPASSADYFVEKITESSPDTMDTWQVDLQLSPAGAIPGVDTALRLDDPVFGALNSYALAY